jgi:hypothetical protein
VENGAELRRADFRKKNAKTKCSQLQILLENRAKIRCAAI